MLQIRSGKRADDSRRLVVAAAACVGSNCERMSGDGVAADGAFLEILGPSDVAGDTAHVSSLVVLVDSILGACLVATSAKGIGCHGNTRLLGVHLVAGDAGNASLAVPARPPFGEGALMTGATQVVGGGHAHALARVFGPVRSMTRFARDTFHDELAGESVIACGVASKAFARLFGLLQIDLEDGIERCLRVCGSRPVAELSGVTFGALLGALKIIAQRA